MAGKKAPTKAKHLADQAVALAESAATTLVAAEQSGIKTKVVDSLPE